MTSRIVKHLNFDWRYSPSFSDAFLSEAFDDGDFQTVQVPHTNHELPYNNFDERSYQFESCYRKTLFVEEALRGRQAILHFEAVMVYARVFVNGQLAGEHKGGYTPFQINVSDHLRYGAENLIVVHVDSREREEIPPFGFVVDYLTYGGIYREVRLEFCHDILIQNCHVRTHHVLETQKTLDLALYLNNRSSQSEQVTAHCQLADGDGKPVTAFSSDLTIDARTSQHFVIKEQVSDVVLWGLATPALYWLKIRLLREGEEIDYREIRFGFREVEFKPSGFYLNGERVKIRGLNRHQSYPYVGYAMPQSVQEKDADILKYELGVNTVRLSHYPQSDHFLNRCDELGLLVFDEIPGWQYLPNADSTSETDNEWRATTLHHVEEMIKKDWNHPSVFIWGVRINESPDCDELYRQTNQLARQLDDTRPTGGVRCIKNSHLFEDVYTYNDFVHDGGGKALDKPANVAGKDVPYLVTEHNGHMFSTKRFDSQAQQLEHALRHLRVIDDAYSTDSHGGAIGWCMFDYNTHKDFGSGDRICYHGVMDMFRIPKYAAAAYASQADNKPFMEIASNMQMGDYPGSELGNIYVFTNCDYIKLYKNGAYVDTFYPAVDEFPHLPHAPVIIDNFIGNLIEENEPFSRSDSQMIKTLLIEIAQKGLDDLPLFSKLKLLYLLKKNSLTLDDGVVLYEKYVAGWGGESTVYRVDGYQGGELVCSQTRGQSTEQKLDVQIDNRQLTESVTWDATRVVIRRIDENNSVMAYANDAMTLDTEGPIEIIGPKCIALIGGAIAFWVRTTGASGTATVRIHSQQFGCLEETLDVVKQPEPA